MSRDERIRRLEQWLEMRRGLPAGAVSVTGFEAPEGVGHSNETILFDAVADGVTERLVLRLRPSGESLFETYDLGLQVEVMASVAQHTDAPVPTVRYYEPDADVLGEPFYIMDRVEGVVPADRMPYTLDGWLHDASAVEQRRLYVSSLDAMARLHRQPVAAVGPGGLDRSSYGPAGPTQLLNWWQDYVSWVSDDRAQPTIDAASTWLRSHLPTDPPPVGLNWGDARLSNIMYRDFEPVALLDWEMAALGPAEVDLAWFLFFGRFFSQGLGVDDLPGFLGHTETIDYYGELLGRDLADLAWYEAFAAWRHSAIMLRLSDLYAASGEIPAGTDAGQNNMATRLLADMLDLPSPGEPGGPLG